MKYVENKKYYIYLNDGGGTLIGWLYGKSIIVAWEELDLYVDFVFYYRHDNKIIYNRPQTENERNKSFLIMKQKPLPDNLSKYSKKERHEMIKVIYEN